MPDNVEDTILDNALAPKRASDDAGSVEQHPIKDQIAAQENQIKQTNARSGRFFKYVKIIPPGAASDA